MVKMKNLQSVVQLFDAQATKSPENIAIQECDGTTTTYGGLSESAHSIARKLRTDYINDNQEDPLIAILVESRKDFITGALAVLRCGKGFVPLDPEHPLERIRGILSDLNNPILISTSTLPIFSSLNYSSTRTCLLDGESTRNGHLVYRREETADYDEHDIMFCLYTSGSTGTPKGVLIEHCSVLNWIDWSVREFGLGPEDRSLAFSSTTFDLSMAQIFPILSVGGRVVEPEPWTGAQALHDYVHRSRITFLYLPTFVGETFFESYASPDLRWLLFAGEMVRKWGFKLPHTMTYGIVNIYGPTEATMGSTFQKFWAGDILNLSVGLPVANNQIHILDESGNPILSPNVLGHVYIEGIGVTVRGYHNRPQANKEYFLDWNGRRLCKPGDLGSWTPEGNLEIHGRIDDQIKIMGRRFELSEIEFHLTQHPLLKEAVAVYDKTTEVLVAFVTRKETEEGLFDETLLQEYLANRVPKEAVPTQIIELSLFPLNSSGKVDKRELLKLVESDKDSQSCTFGTAQEFVDMLRDEWATVLDVPRLNISPESNFFAVGGDSHFALALIARLRRLLPPLESLRVVTVFTHPTLGILGSILYTELEERVSSKQMALQLPPQETFQFLLSLAQEQVWLSLQRSGQAKSFNVLRLVEFKNGLDMDRLQRALEVTFNQNPGLRTRFFTIDKEPWQSIQDQTCVEVKVLDLDQKEGLLGCINEIWSTELNLATGPLVRLFIWKPTNQLIVLYHHLVMDGIGWAGFLQSIDKHYNNKNHIADAAYFTTVFKERNTPIPERSIKYWKNRLMHMNPVASLQMFPDPSALATSSSKNYIVLREMSLRVTTELKVLACSEETTLFTLLLTLFKVLTFRILGERDQTLLTLLRTGASQDTSVLGHFVNLVPVHTMINLDMNFQQFLEMVKEALTEGLEHGSVPFHKIMELVKPKPADQETLLQIMFQMQPLILPELESCVEIPLNETPFSRIDFGMDVEEMAGDKGLRLSVEYNPLKYTRDFADQFLSLYEQLCKSILEPNGMHTAVTELKMVPDSQHAWILDHFTKSNFENVDPNESLIKKFLKIVQERPNSLCIRDEHSPSTRDLSYKELDDESHRLAAKLSKPKYLILLLTKSANLIVATLAGLKTGSTLVPLTLAQTELHFEMVLADLGEDYVLVAEEKTKAQIPRSAEQNRILLIDELGQAASERYLNTASSNPSMDTVYCFFTSGTTGRPKGVLVPQRALLNCITAYQQKFDFSRHHTAIFFHNPGFDASLMDFLPALLSGSTVVIPPPQLSHQPGLLWKYMSEKKITFANLPTFVATTIFSEFESLSHIPTSLQWLVLGGERLRVPPPSNFPSKCINAYGPTETTVDATFAKVTPESVLKCSIGRPLTNVRVYILDTSLRLLPPHVEGLIWIGGVGLSVGYLNRELLTAEAFIPNPFVDGERIFRTGDLGVWTPEGEILLSSRADQQVKINGFRLELEGIEYTLSTHPQIKEAAVVAMEEKGSAFLVAFFTPLNPEGPPSPAALQQFLAQHLAYYAVPQVYLPLLRIPINPNMKIDRKALRMTYQNLPPVPLPIRGGEPAQLTPTEMLVSEIWSGMLGVKKSEMSADTSFYALGGTSLKLGPLLRSIESKFGLTLSFHDLVRYTTLGGLSSYIDSKAAIQSVVQAKLSKTQEDIWFHQIFFLQNSALYHKCMVLRMEPNTTWEVLRPKVQALLSKYYEVLSLGTRVTKEGILVTTRFSEEEIDRVVRLDRRTIKSIGVYEEAEEVSRHSYYDLLNSTQPLFHTGVVGDEDSTWLLFYSHQILNLPESLFLDLEKLGFSPHIEISTPTSEPNDYKNGYNNGLNGTKKKSMESQDPHTLRQKIWRGIVAKTTSLLLGVPIRSILDGLNEGISFETLGGSRAKTLQLYTTLQNLTGGTRPSFYELHQTKTLNNLIQKLSPINPVPMNDADFVFSHIFENEFTELANQLCHCTPEAGLGPLNAGQTVFLTGATGYLGAFMLENLLHNSGVEKVYALVRGKTERIYEALEKYEISKFGLDKLIPVLGSLSQSQLGINHDMYKQISEEVNFIYHCGAEVNLVKSYEGLRGPNVLGTLEICKLALSSPRLRGLQYISSSDSTVGRFVFETKEQVMDEVIPEFPPYLDIGYYQTKWVSEKLVQFVSQWVSTVIFRVGTVGAPSDGRMLVNRGSFDGILLRTSVLIGGFPDFNGFTVPYSDVDYVAQFICSNTSPIPSPGMPPLILNVVQRNYKFAHLFQGYSSVSPVSPESWYGKLKSYLQANPEDELSQQLLLVFQQRPWANLSPIPNYFKYIESMPIMHYPVGGTHCATNLNDLDMSTTSIKKYICLHTQKPMDS